MPTEYYSDPDSSENAADAEDGCDEQNAESDNETVGDTFALNHLIRAMFRPPTKDETPKSYVEAAYNCNTDIHNLLTSGYNMNGEPRS